MTDKIIVTGSSGLVGSRFVELFHPKKLLNLPTEREMDITNKDSVAKLIEQVNPGCIVNFAAYTDVGEAEKQRGDRDGSCWRINVEGVKNLVSVVAAKKIFFIQISTDNVFSGSREDKGPYDEGHLVEKDSDKLTWYGFTKAHAEKSAQEGLGEMAAILRINYPVRANFTGKLDYFRKPLKLYDEGKLYPMFDNQQVTISFIDEVAEVIKKLIKHRFFGIYHASTADVTSPYELISYLLLKARRVKNAVKSTSIDDFLTTVDNPVRYPKYGGLEVKTTQDTLGIKFLKCRQVIDKLIIQGLSYT